MTTPASSTRIAPRVLIVGAGLSGLMLAILFERMGDIEYSILERASAAKPLGSAMSLTPSIQILFEQLGMGEELKKISLPSPVANLYDEELNLLGAIVHPKTLDRIGQRILLPRPDLFDLLLSKIPAERMLWGKRVLKVDEDDEANKDQVTITCADGSQYAADMVVGADGVYSSVRQNMYRVMSEQEILPKEDDEPLNVGFACMVGITSAMDPEKYPELKDDFAHFRSVVGGVRHNWGAINMPNNKFTWQFNLQYLDEKEAKQKLFMNSEWGPESNKEMLDEFKELPNPFGGKMADFINETPPELVSRVFLEYKLFKTWYHGRCVLVGDACHKVALMSREKMLPGGGAGAVNAFQDAVILANCLYDVEDRSVSSLQAAFQSYYEQRYEGAKEAYNTSEVMSKVMSGLTWQDRLARWLVMRMPQWVQQRNYEKAAAYRPQVMFLPQVGDHGMVPALPQKPCARYLALQSKAVQAEVSTATGSAVV
ncbi:hypothetical protein EMPS_06426 [Entomortierella parvispora]|uniref:FAD-binding domain-containing protein n=1 Tax=Entomortierella parvispora TaxID=205924 RepID=A0A9P3HCP5_9FUNG|nr:hypothetical protein EMPS_06426 [Entomortierella parvispora]